MKLVEFENGKFGVRLFSLFWYEKFIDLKKPDFSWAMKSRFAEDCMGTKEEALMAMNSRKTPKYKVVKE